MITITFKYCGQSISVDVPEGATVSRVREILGDVFGIRPDATPVVNGQEAEETQDIQSGDRVEFRTPSSTKN